ncbi:MAG: fibronectin type III domain-containing protein [Thiohalomonadales bacterium]
MAGKFDINLAAFALGVSLLFSLSGCSGGNSGDTPSAVTKAPSAPTNLTTVDVDPTIPRLADSTIILSWDNIPGARYKIYMASEPGVNKRGLKADGVTPLRGFMTHSSAPRPYTHIDLRSCSHYYFSIVVVGADGAESALSAELRATTSGGQLVAASNLAAKDTTFKQVDLNWQDNSCVDTGYTIERATLSQNGDVGAWTELASLAKDTLIYTDTAVTPVTTYQYRVQAFTDNETSDFSNSLRIDVPQINVDRFLSFENNNATRFKESQATALAYYQAIDPNDKKTTFADWKKVNGFALGANQSADTAAIYFNNTDLGFGRRMYVTEQADGGIASYVQNYPTLDDALNDNNLIATVAMEYTQPAVDVVAAARKQVVIGQNLLEYAQSAILQRDLLPGRYRVVAARGVADLNSTASFTLSINYRDSVTPDFMTSGNWVDSWAGANYTDPANTFYDFVVPLPPTPQVPPVIPTLTIELASDIANQIILLQSVGYVIDEDDNSGGGTVAEISLKLDPGEYRVLPAAVNAYIQNVAPYNSATLTISGAAITDLMQGVRLMPAGTNDPNVTAITNNPVSFSVSTSGIVTITLTAVTDAIVDPYLYLLSDIGSAQAVEVFRPIGYATQQPIQRGKAAVSVDLPAGTYTAVAAASGQLNVNDVPFAIQLFDQNGAELSFDDPSVSQVWPSIGGANPYLPENPRLNFTITPASGTQSQRVTVRLSVDPAFPSVFPMLYVMGDIGQYRHIEAVDTGKAHVGPPVNEARIDNVLNIGNYTVVAATTKKADAGSFRLDVSDPATSLLNISDTWIASSGSAVQGAGNPQAQFSITQDNTPITIRLRTTARTNLTTAVEPVVYLLDSTGRVIRQNTLVDANKSYIDTQLLPGNYRLVAATKTSSGKRADFSLDVLIDGVAQTQINGAWISSAQSNPYSPTNPRFPLVLTKNSHVSATLSSRKSLTNREGSSCKEDNDRRKYLALGRRGEWGRAGGFDREGYGKDPF